MELLYEECFDDPLYIEAVNSFKNFETYISQYKTVSYLMEEVQPEKTTNDQVVENNKTMIKKIIDVVRTSMNFISKSIKKIFEIVKKGLTIAGKLVKKVDNIILKNPKTPEVVKTIYNMIAVPTKFMCNFIKGICGDIKNKDGKGLCKRVIQYFVHSLCGGELGVAVLTPIVGGGLATTINGPIPSSSITNDIVKIFAKYKVLFSSEDVMELPSTLEVLNGYKGSIIEVLSTVSEKSGLNQLENKRSKVDPKQLEQINRFCKNLANNYKAAEKYCSMLTDDLASGKYTIPTAAKITARQVKRDYKKNMKQKKKEIKKGVIQGLNLDMEKPRADVEGILSRRGIKTIKK